jgi:hypothetical protein
VRGILVIVELWNEKWIGMICEGVDAKGRAWRLNIYSQDRRLGLGVKIRSYLLELPWRLSQYLRRDLK